MYTPRTLALHDGSAFAVLSEEERRRMYDERRDGPGGRSVATGASNSEAGKSKGKSANGAGPGRTSSSSSEGREGQTHERDAEEPELDVGGYVSPSAFSTTDSSGTASSADPSTRILLAINRQVYDVTSGRNFYGPGGPYAIFAGRDASVGMARQSFDPEVLTPLDQPIAKLDGAEGGLTPMELGNMREWMAHFAGKYGVVGRLVNEGEEELEQAAQ